MNKQKQKQEKTQYKKKSKKNVENGSREYITSGII